MTHLSQIMKDGINGSTFISLTTSTDVKLTGGKKNPHQGLVKKITTGSHVMIFQNKHKNGYNAMVERRLTAEGKNPDSFTLGPRVWGTRIPDTPFVEHKGGHYMEVIFLKPGKVHYELDGVETKRNFINGLPDTPQAPKQGHLDNKVVVRCYNLDSITAMTINKQTYNNIQY